MSGDHNQGEGRWVVTCSCGLTVSGTPRAIERFSREHDDSPLNSHVVSWDLPGVKPWSRGEAVE